MKPKKQRKPYGNTKPNGNPHKNQGKHPQEGQWWTKMRAILDEVFVNHFFFGSMITVLAVTFIACWIYDWVANGSPYGRSVWLAGFGVATILDLGIYSGCLTLRSFSSSPSPVSNLLLPANDPDPPNIVAAKEKVPNMRGDAVMKVILGSNIGYTSKDMWVVLRLSGNDLLTMHRDKNGILINAKIFADDGKILAQIKDNEFFINEKNSFRIERPDTHTLIVYDLQAEQALNIQYLNPTLIRVFGIFRYSDSLLVATDGSVILSNSHFGGMEIGGNIVGDSEWGMFSFS